jgi:hypothetical protein
MGPVERATRNCTTSSQLIPDFFQVKYEGVLQMSSEHATPGLMVPESLSLGRKQPESRGDFSFGRATAAQTPVARRDVATGRSGGWRLARNTAVAVGVVLVLGLLWVPELLRTILANPYLG